MKRGGDGVRAKWLGDWGGLGGKVGVEGGSGWVAGGYGSRRCEGGNCV